MRPENRTFIVSGGCSGLGLATARDLHSAGAYVSLLDLNGDAGARIAKELGERAVFFETDVSDTESIKTAIDGTATWVKKTGKAIGGVIAAAGVGAAAKVMMDTLGLCYCAEELMWKSCPDYRWSHR
jgi:NAD(P)-dependent dehydrogenase (short-subunit alcohol dehydrogenase family)